MYTAYMGRRLVDLVNARNQTQYTVQEFFDDEYYKVFFDDTRYLLHVNNSKFDQAYKQRGKKPLTAAARANSLRAQHQRIQNDAPDGSFFLGGAAATATAGTSGQVTDIKLPISPEEVYASWIGAALGIGVSGGLNVLIDADEVLLTLYNGWTHYRTYMTQTINLKPHQINTWNGWWLTNAFRRDYDATHPFERQPDVKIDKTSGGVSLETQKWVKVFFSLARKLPDSNSLTTYVYSLSQMNTTVGFILIGLPEIITVEREVRKQLVAQEGYLNEDAFDDLYTTELGFQKVCELGTIGVQSLEPEGLRDYMPSYRGPGKLFKPLNDRNDPLRITYAIYQTWIIAMLNNQKLLELSEQIAYTLTTISDVSERAKTMNTRFIEDVLTAKGRVQLIERFAKLVDGAPTQHSLLNEASNMLTTMPVTDIPLFMALLKLKYAVEKAKN